MSDHEQQNDRQDDRQDDRDLRALLHDTAAGITPHGSLDEIKERVMNENDNRRWVLPAVAAAAVMALVVGGVGWMLRDDDKTSAPPIADTPSATPTPSTSPTTAAVGKPVDVDAYFAGESTQGHSLFKEVHQVPEMGTTGIGDLEEAVQLAIDGQPLDPDYESLWPAGVTVRDVAFDGVGADGIITVALEGPAQERPAGMDDRDAKLAIDAVVRTAQSVTRSPAKVEFSDQDGEMPQVLGVDGSTFTAGEDDTFLAPMQITSLVDGQTVPLGKLTVSGVAAAFEANVLWELKSSTGTTISNFTTAAECCTLAPYSFDVELINPGTYTVTVHDEDMSGENRPVNSDTKEIVVG